jgi:hypothetical protein
VSNTLGQIRAGRCDGHERKNAPELGGSADEKRHDDPLGGIEENGTLGGEGCAWAAAAMVFKFYGIKTDPQQLNWFLPSVGGYTENGWIYWDRAAWWTPDRCSAGHKCYQQHFPSGHRRAA